MIVQQRFRSWQAAPGYECSTSAQVPGVNLPVLTVEVGAWGQTFGVDVGGASVLGWVRVGGESW